MKTTVETKLLKRAMRVLAQVAEKSGKYPTLESVRVSAAEGCMNLASFGLLGEAQAEVVVPADGDLAVRYVSRKRLEEILKATTTATVSFFAAEGELRLGFEKAETENLHKADGVDIPFLFGEDTEEDKAPGKAQASALAAAIDFLSPALSTDPTRYALNHLRIEGGELVATDGHRLHLANLGENVVNGSWSLAPSAVRAVRAAMTAAYTDDVVNIERVVTGKEKATRLWISGSGVIGWSVIASMDDGSYPDYRQVIPKSRKRFAAHVDAAALSSAIIEARRVVKTAGKETASPGVNLLMRNGVLEVDAAVVREIDKDGNALNVSREVAKLKPGQVEGFDDAFGMSVSCEYLSDAIAGAERVTLFFGGDCLDPVVVDRGNGQSAVVMPMRMGKVADAAAEILAGRQLDLDGKPMAKTAPAVEAPAPKAAPPAAAAPEAAKPPKAEARTARAVKTPKAKAPAKAKAAKAPRKLKTKAAKASKAAAAKA